jgi:hypothetical protein
MPSNLIIPAHIAKNLAQVIRTYFTNADSEAVVRLEILEAVERTMHDVLVASGSQELVQEYEWLDGNPYYVPFKTDVNPFDLETDADSVQ